MMTVVDGLTDTDDRRWPMAGLMPGEVGCSRDPPGLAPRQGGRPRVRCAATPSITRSSTLEPAALPHGYTVNTGTCGQGEAVFEIGSLTASYFHAYLPSNPPAVAALFRGDEA